MVRFALIALLYACAGSPPDTDTQDTDTDTQDTDTDTQDTDTEPQDTGPASGLDCVFNSDCPADERCGCDEATGCFCEHGARGTGVSGVDTCTDGNDCETSLCVEGHGDVFYCSGPCETLGDCGPNLPNCVDIAFIGRICIREAE